MFNITIISLVVGFIALVIATITDVKTREVPDWLTYSLILFGIGSAIILGLYHGYPHIILDMLIGLVIGIGLGLLMFYTGQWGGGDSKLIIGLAAIIGFSLSELRTGVPMLIVFFVNILIVGAAYGLVFSFVKAIRNYKKFKVETEKRMRSREVFIMRVVLVFFGVAAFIFLLATWSVESFIMFGVVASLFVFFYLWSFVTVVEKTCMIKDVLVSKLTEGDWIVNNVTKKKGKKEKVILKPTKTGITLKQIALLKKNRIRKVAVKIGVPFVPSFLIAYAITFLFGNWIAFFL